MIKIAICDDDVLICNQISNIIKTYSEKVEIDYKVYLSAQEFQNQIFSGVTYDLVFLDIELPEITGIEIGRKLRDNLYDEQTKIVFISHSDSYMKDLFRIRPLDFLKKPLRVSDIIFNIDKCMELNRLNDDMFSFEFRQVTHEIPLRHIVYFENRGRVIIIHSANEEFRFYMSMDDLMKRIDMDRFWRISKSFLINTLQIHKLTYREVEMKSGKILPISQTHRKTIRQKQFDIMKLGGIKNGII